MIFRPIHAAAAALTVLSLIAVAPVAQACSPAFNDLELYEPDGTIEDDSPPAAAVVTVEINDDPPGPFGCYDSSCSDTVFVRLDLAGAQDDQTAFEDLAWRVELLDGDGTYTLSEFEEGPMIIEPSDSIYMVRGTDPFSMTIALTPIDQAGNEGPTTVVDATYGGLGCQIGANGSGGALALGLLGFLGISTVRRRRARA